MPDRLPHVVTNKAVVAGAVILVGFWSVARFFPVADVLEHVTAALAAMAVAVSISYLPDAYRRLASHRPNDTAATYLSVGIACRWLTDVAWRSLAILWLLGGTPDWMIHNYLVASFIVLGIYSGALHLAAKEAIDGRIPRQKYVKVGCWVGAASFLGYLVVVSRPDLTAFVATLEPWIPRCRIGMPC